MNVSRMNGSVECCEMAVSVVRSLSASSEAVGGQGDTPLHVAAVCNHVAMVGWLVHHGASLEVRNAQGDCFLVS